MSGIQQVVVGLDEGHLADSAVVTALHLARLLHAPLEVVHAVQTRAEHPWFAGEQTMQKLQDQVLAEARKHRSAHLWKLLQPFATTHAEIDEMLHVSPGRSDTVLATHVADRDNPVVILGGHRHRGLLDFGGTTRRMIHNLLCPIWVQDDRPWNEIRNILVPLDLSPGSVRVLALAKGIAHAAGAGITVMHCFEPLTYTYGADTNLEAVIDEMRERERQEFDAFMDEHISAGMSVKRLFEDGESAPQVLARQKEHDLIVMGTHGHTGIGRIVLGSQAYRVLREAERPVVVVPQPSI